MHLQSFGFSSFFLAQLSLDELSTLPVGRVATASHERYTLWTADGPQIAVPSGRLRQQGTLPCVGDWVVFDPTAPLRVQRVLERSASFQRRGADGSPQVIAANINTVFVVMSVDEDFSIRRVERYLAAVHASGASPAVVLTKLDLHPDPLPLLRQVERAVRGVPVIPVCAPRGEGREALLAFVGQGQTVAFTGSSGVGKSTLVNWLIGAPTQATQAVRDSDSTGRHTTTARSLFALPGGGLLLDTPGMRGFALPDDADLDAVFEDIHALAVGCRYRDCTHATEPGCAVQGAIACGELDPARLAALQRLTREEAYAARREDPALQRAERQRWKKIHAQQRARDAARDRLREG